MGYGNPGLSWGNKRVRPKPPIKYCLILSAQGPVLPVGAGEAGIQRSCRFHCEKHPGRQGRAGGLSWINLANVRRKI